MRHRRGPRSGSKKNVISTSSITTSIKVMEHSRTKRRKFNSHRYIMSDQLRPKRPQHGSMLQSHPFFLPPVCNNISSHSKSATVFPFQRRSWVTHRQRMSIHPQILAVRGKITQSAEVAWLEVTQLAGNLRTFSPQSRSCSYCKKRSDACSCPRHSKGNEYRAYARGK